MLGQMPGSGPRCEGGEGMPASTAMEATEIELRLWIEPEREPISGRIGAAAGPPVRFRGYMQLIAALERIRDGDPVERELFEQADEL